MIIEGRRKGIIAALIEAGKAIQRIEESGKYDIVSKADDSPLTTADSKSDQIICSSLENLYPGIPIISEERKEFSSDNKASQFWLLDPLDGTKEFIKGNGEYCISLALIRDGRPVEAYIYSPVSEEFWLAEADLGAFKIDKGSLIRLPTTDKAEQAEFVLLRSRSHHNDKEGQWYKDISQKEKISIQLQGSAIKFCRMAQGDADFYLKKGRIFGWDMAAGDLILEESGGGIIDLDSRDKIEYMPADIEMPHFLAHSFRIKVPKKWLK